MQEKLEKLALLSPISNNDQWNSKEISEIFADIQKSEQLKNEIFKNEKTLNKIESVMRIWKLKLDREDVISHWITTVEGKVVLIPMEASGSEKMAFHTELQIEPKCKELFKKHKKNVSELKKKLLAIVNEETKKEMDSYVDRAPK